MSIRSFKQGIAAPADSAAKLFTLRRTSVLLAVFAVGGVGAVAAVADNVKNAVAPNGIGEGGLKEVTLPASGPATAVIPYYIQATGSDGCDAADGSAATVTINVPEGVTVSPTSLTFTSCGEPNSQNATFSGATLGTYDIPQVAVADADTTDDYGAAGTAFKFRIVAASGGGGSGGANVPPVVSTAALDSFVTEGSTLSSSGAFADANAGDTLTLSANNAVGTFYDYGDGTWSWSLPTSDDVKPQTTITVTANDGHGGTATDSFDYRADNGDPELSALAVAGTNCTPSLSFSFTDPGSGDLHTGTVNWGDSSTPDGFTVSPFSGSHPYSAAGVYPVTVNVADDDGGTDSATVGSGYTVYNIPSTILQPINYTGPRSLFKLGSTIPVKITVTSCGGGSVGTLSPQVGVKLLDQTPDGTFIEPTSTAAPTTGTTMRYDATAAQYIYNLGTKTLSAGDWSIKVTDPTFATPVEAIVSIKK